MQLNLSKLDYNNKKHFDEMVIVGCYHCKEIFNSDEILEYIDDNHTAICPFCAVDAVISIPKLLKMLYKSEF